MTQETSPTVTVLMAMYNGGEFLRMSIASILEQTYRDFEFLIVNDGSTDNSLELINSFSDKRIRVHTNEENMGQTKSLNVGLQLARGKYIARIDADDVAFPHWLETQMEYLDKNPDCTVVSTKAVVIDEENRVRKVLNSPLKTEDIILRCLVFSPINHVGSLMNKEIITGAGGYDPHFKIAADYELWSNLIREGYRLSSTKDVLMAIRFHEQSSSIIQSQSHGVPEISEIIERNIRRLTEVKGISKEEVSLLWKLIYHVDMLDVDEFLKADEILRNVYQNLKPSLKIKDDSIQRRIKDSECTVYMKKIKANVRERDVSGIRHVARDFIQKWGIGNLFSLIWIASFFGMIFLRFLPFLYERILLRVFTKCQLRKKSFPASIH